MAVYDSFRRAILRGPFKQGATRSLCGDRCFYDRLDRLGEVKEWNDCGDWIRWFYRKIKLARLHLSVSSNGARSTRFLHESNGGEGRYEKALSLLGVPLEMKLYSLDILSSIPFPSEFMRNFEFAKHFLKFTTTFVTKKK